MNDLPGPPDAMRSEIVLLRDGRGATIRPATVDDAPQVQENINSIGAEVVYILAESVGNDLDAERDWIRQFDGVSSVLFVAEVDGMIVGQGDVHPGRPPKESHVGTIGIAIRDGYREVGLGRALMERLLEWMRDRQFHKACLEVFSTNARAIALYKACGFEVEGVRRRQYRILNDWVDDVVMGKWLG